MKLLNLRKENVIYFEMAHEEHDEIFENKQQQK